MAAEFDEAVQAAEWLDVTPSGVMMMMAEEEFYEAVEWPDATTFGVMTVAAETGEAAASPNALRMTAPKEPARAQTGAEAHAVRLCGVEMALSFEEAAERVKTTKAKPTNEQLLEIYGWYKQATEGDNTKPQPGFSKVKDRAKWNVWKKNEGTSVEDAKKKYVETVLAFDPTLENASTAAPSDEGEAAAAPRQLPAPMPVDLGAVGERRRERGEVRRDRQGAPVQLVALTSRRPVARPAPASPMMRTSFGWLALTFALLIAPITVPTFAISLSPACILLSPLTRFMMLFVGCLAASRCARKALRSAWPNANLGSAKELEAIGDLTKAVGRLVILAHLLPLWTFFSFAAGLDVGAVCAMPFEAFESSRYLVAALMAWELAFNPAVPCHVYVHHSFLLLLVVWGVDKSILNSSLQLVGGGSATQPTIVNGYVFLLLHVAVIGPPVKELLIVKYRHLPREDGASRARLLRWASRWTEGAATLTVLVLPSVYLGVLSTQPTMAVGAGVIALGCTLVLCLALIELYFIRHLRRVALALERRSARTGKAAAAGHAVDDDKGAAVAAAFLEEGRAAAAATAAAA
jgi:diazepam-binding inhibitor (GABA receptor modulating acyl-CoA-binding protein)